MSTPSLTAAPRLTLSIVSHGQGHLIRNLLSDLSNSPLDGCEILLTLNIPESEAFLSAFAHLPLRLIRNSAPKGFGGNHNAAFAASSAPCFAIVNPDIRATPLDVTSVLETLSEGRIGACAPLVLAPDGGIEDSARRFPRPIGLVKRVLGGRRGPDYAIAPGSSPRQVDWVAGMFVVFPREAFAAVGGFDERYFMYMEDVDICRRLGQAGWATWIDPRSAVVHDAQRASRRSMRHLRWHLTSALRYFTGL
jgi:N-acetylglucosaminyl-diphospho-decaprenol L-rhamnosyltransferase